MNASATSVTPPPAPSPGGAQVRVSAAQGLLAPSCCACCMEPAGVPERLEANGGPVVVVHYCNACHTHAAQARTNAWAIGVASALLGFGAAAALVLTFGSLRPTLQCLLAGAAALLPALALLRHRPLPPHTARGPAAWWRREGDGSWALVCTHSLWAAQLAIANGARCDPIPRRPVRLPLFLLASTLLAAMSVPAAHALLGVEVRVLNLYAEPAVIVVDGRHRGTVPSSSVESPAAGLRLHLLAGERHVQLISRDGRILADDIHRFRPGIDHLIAVSGEPVCFRVERNVYGRAAAPQVTREPLSGAGPVWELPSTIHSWFAPNPPPSEADGVSTGGALVALRQGRCETGPPRSSTSAHQEALATPRVHRRHSPSSASESE